MKFGITFLSPDDLYNPYKVVSLSSITNEYVIEFKHRYGGRQEIVLNLINNAPKKFDYDNPDKINLKFKTIVKCDDVRVTEDFLRSFTTYFLMPGNNWGETPKRLIIPFEKLVFL